MEVDCQAKPLVNCLGGITDSRMKGESEHKIIDILVDSICAVICGAEHWTEIEAFGICKRNWFSSFLELPNGIPSHDTIGRVFSIIDPGQLQGRRRRISLCYGIWALNLLKQGTRIKRGIKTRRKVAGWD